MHCKTSGVSDKGTSFESYYDLPSAFCFSKNLYAGHAMTVRRVVLMSFNIQNSMRLGLHLNISRGIGLCPFLLSQ